MGVLSIFSSFFKRRKKKDEDFVDLEEHLEKSEVHLVLSRDDVDIKDDEQRARFVQSCLEQIADATREVEGLNGEYQLVDSYLKDVEEIEEMRGDDREFMETHARGIVTLELDNSKIEQRKNPMSDSDYRKMERFDTNLDEEVAKLREAEEYQAAIKQDLQRLEGEKHACRYRIEEAESALNNLKGMAVICVCAVFVCMGMLLVLQFGFKMDTTMGYVLTAGTAAITLTVLYLRYIENMKERRSAARSFNKLVLLQNKVKIRYINNTNLLDYLYIKFGVSSGRELAKLWGSYQSEKVERVRIEQVGQDLEFHQEQLVRLLKRYRLFDPVIWVHQAEAILDRKEMVEVRHGLIERRQKLRKQIEYNTKNAEDAQNEIKELVTDYKEYAEEVLKMVSNYEKRFKSK